MTITTPITLTSDAGKAHSFSPIRMDLVDRLTRECDSRRGRKPARATANVMITANQADLKTSRAS